MPNCNFCSIPAKVVCKEYSDHIVYGPIIGLIDSDTEDPIKTVYGCDEHNPSVYDFAKSATTRLGNRMTSKGA